MVCFYDPWRLLRCWAHVRAAQAVVWCRHKVYDHLHWRLHSLEGTEMDTSMCRGDGRHLLLS